MKPCLKLITKRGLVGPVFVVSRCKGCDECVFGWKLPTLKEP